jgi:hypothetical protein
MKVHLRKLSDVVKSKCSSFRVKTLGGSVSLNDQIEKLKSSPVKPEFLCMHYKFSNMDSSVHEFPWPKAEESPKAVSVEMMMLSQNTLPEKAIALMEKEGYRFVSLQEFLTLIEKQHPADLTPVYAIFDKKGKMGLFVSISSGGYVFEPLSFSDKVLTVWVLPCVRQE